MKRIAMCWKCSSGYFLKRVTDNKQHPNVYCLKTAYIVLDHSNPPAGCPVRKHWEEEDAKEKE